MPCPYASTDPYYAVFHDEEWGVPVHDDKYATEPCYPSLHELYKIPQTNSAIGCLIL